MPLEEWGWHNNNKENSKISKNDHKKKTNLSRYRAGQQHSSSTDRDHIKKGFELELELSCSLAKAH